MLGALISAGSSLLGGLLGKSSADKALDAQKENLEKQAQLQREFAQNGIQWKVEDAKKAGIHPIYALGGSTASYTPSAMSIGADNSLGAGIAAAGQDIGRAMYATQDASGRSDMFSKTVQGLQLQRMGLENQLLASQIAKVNAPGTPPPMPALNDRVLLPGQAQSTVPQPDWMADFKDLLNYKPADIGPAVPGSPQLEPGVITSVRHAKTASGYEPVPSTQMKQAIEDDFISEVVWNLKNRLGPIFGVNQTPPAGGVDPAKGEYWKYNPFLMEYQKKYWLPKSQYLRR